MHKFLYLCSKLLAIKVSINYIVFDPRDKISGATEHLLFFLSMHDQKILVHNFHFCVQ